MAISVLSFTLRLEYNAIPNTMDNFYAGLRSHGKIFAWTLISTLLCPTSHNTIIIITIIRTGIMMEAVAELEHPDVSRRRSDAPVTIYCILLGTRWWGIWMFFRCLSNIVKYNVHSFDRFFIIINAKNIKMVLVQA